MDNQKSLGLGIPERTAAPESSFLSNEKAVESWIAGLPMASVGETSRQVFKAIVEFNRLEMPTLHRVKVAELFRQPIGYISDNLRKHYFDTAFPLSAKNRKIAILNRELYSELALAYKIYIEDSISGKSGKLDRKLLVIALHRTMRALSWVLYQSALIYAPPPTGTWREINRLYAYAEKNQVHDLPVKEGKNTAAASSISELYRQILLLAICSPYRLRQREMEHVQLQLPDWSRRLTLGKIHPGSHPSTQFIVRLGLDSPPLHMDLQGQDINQHCRQVDSTGLLRLLRETFDKMPPEKGTVESHSTNGRTSKQLLRKIIQMLSRVPKRRFVRTQLKFELLNVVGLSSIHQILSLEPEPEADDDEAADEQDIAWFDTQEEQKPLINTLLYTSGSSMDYSLVPMGTPVEDEAILATGVQGSVFGAKSAQNWNGKQQALPAPFSFKTINESAGGYCIRWQGADAPKIKVGEILGIQSASDKKQFSIGISRWLKNIPGLGLQVGMELISPKSIAVTALIADGEFPAAPENCLLLPELEASGQTSTLLAPPLCFKVADLLLVDLEGDEKRIRLTRLLESTGTFAQFQFVYIDDEASRDSVPEGDDNMDFDNIWSGI